MKPRALLAAALAAALLPHALADAAVPLADNHAVPFDDDGDHYDLESMSDAELEELCTARGFDLVRDADAEYSHEDYVEAASECLQIDEDLEEILRTHPEILEDVRRERERMEEERDALRAELERQQREEEGPNALPNDETATGSDEGRENAPLERTDGAASPRQDAALSGEENQESFDLKVITREVLEQMKADFRACANFLVPPRRQEQLRTLFQTNIRPALAPCATVVRGMCTSVYDVACRQWTRAETATPNDGGEEVTAAPRNGTAASEENAAGSGAPGVPPESEEVFDPRPLEQLKRDLRACAMFLVPPRQREQLRTLFEQKIRPALAPCARVVRGMCARAYDVACRQWTAAGGRIAEDVRRKRERLEGARDALSAQRGARDAEAREVGAGRGEPVAA